MGSQLRPRIHWRNCQPKKVARCVYRYLHRDDDAHTVEPAMLSLALYSRPTICNWSGRILFAQIPETEQPSPTTLRNAMSIAFRVWYVLFYKTHHQIEWNEADANLLTWAKG